jgi:type VI protein secretion system component Hcp
VGHQSVSGSAQFKNLRFVTSAMDAYTPSLMQAAVTGESFTSAAFSFIEYGAGGKPQITMTITLLNGYATNVDIVGGLIYVELSAQTLKIDTIYKTSCDQPFYSK